MLGAPVASRGSKPRAASSCFHRHWGATAGHIRGESAGVASVLMTALCDVGQLGDRVVERVSTPKPSSGTPSPALASEEAKQQAQAPRHRICLFRYAEKTTRYRFSPLTSHRRPALDR